MVLVLIFHEVSATILNRSIPIEYPELYEKLLDHEIFLKHQSYQNSSLITAVVANKTIVNTLRTNYNRNTRRYNNGNYSNNSSAWRPNNRYTQPFQSRQQQNHNYNNGVQC